MGFFSGSKNEPDPKAPAAPTKLVQPQPRKAVLHPLSSIGLATSRGELTGVLANLVKRAVITAQVAAGVQDEAARINRQPHEILILKKLAPYSEIYEAIYQQPTALRNEINLVVRSVTQLPEWSIVLNDVQGPLGGAERNPDVIAVASTEDVYRDDKGRQRGKCFVLVTPKGANSMAFGAIASKAITSGYAIRAVVPLADESIAGQIWSTWDYRRGATEGQSVASAASNMQKLFDRIGRDGYSKNASDIHVIAKGGVGQILFRIDGDVVEQPQYKLTGREAIELCRSVYDTLTEKSSVKEGFSQTSLQDASIDRPYDDCRLRFRYAGMPVEPGGYRVAMRIIPIGTHRRPMSLSQLGYADSQCAQLDRAFSRSSGLVLFMGTTGSGKSTTLSNRLAQLVLERPTKAVLTVEEPVEYIIPGAHQTAVLRKEGENGQNAFQRTLAEIMRSDPDVLMLGEIRDIQTADMALQGVRSGHLLLSTLHAGAAPTGYDRLAGLGVPRIDMAAMDLVAAFVFQALVQTLCPRCKILAHEYVNTKDPVLAAVMRRLRTVLDRGGVPGASGGADSLEGIFFRNYSGCEHCHGRGITGRTVCAETFSPTPAMLDPISRGDSRAVWRMWREQINRSEPSDMTGRRAIEHAMWKMGPGGGGVVSPLEVESQFRMLDEPVFEK